MNGPMTLMLIIGISAELIEKLISSAPGNHYPGRMLGYMLWNTR